MIHLYDDFYFDSDGKYNITLYKKKIVAGTAKGGKPVRPENIGKPFYEPVGYYGTLEQMLSGFARKVTFSIIQDERMKSLTDVTDKIQSVLDGLHFTLEIEGAEKTITAKTIKGSEQA